MINTNIVIDTQTWTKIASEAYEIQITIKHLRDKERSLKDKLAMYSGYKSYTDGNYIYKKTDRKGSINYSAIQILQTMDLEQYRKDGVIVWSLSKLN